jgi:hypothetical protein
MCTRHDRQSCLLPTFIKMLAGAVTFTHNEVPGSTDFLGKFSHTYQHFLTDNSWSQSDVQV